jgi:PIN domain
MPANIGIPGPCNSAGRLGGYHRPVAFPALLDACVLYPVGVRDLLLCVAEREVYVPYWTDDILDEMERNVVADGRASADRMAVMRQQMNTAFPAALIEGYAALIPVMTNNPKDRHVLAAAVRGAIGLIVTENVSDFPPSACQPYEIEVQTADEFLSDALDQDPPAVIGAVHTMATKRRRPPTSPLDLLTALSPRLAVFTAEAIPLLDTINSGEG